MSDWLDDATALQDLHTDLSLQAQLAKSNFSRNSKAWCDECDGKIPPARMLLGGVTLCVECQTDKEKMGAT